MKKASSRWVCGDDSKYFIKLVHIENMKKVVEGIFLSRVVYENRSLIVDYVLGCYYGR